MAVNIMCTASSEWIKLGGNAPFCFAGFDFLTPQIS